MTGQNIEAWILVTVLVVSALLVGALLRRGYQHGRSIRLQQRFGPEYDRLLNQHGDRAEAEAELIAREKRIGHLRIAALTAAEVARFSRDWRALQSRFVDTPAEVVAEADRLMRDVMMRQGYPTSDFDTSAADISLDYPRAVANYRAAQAIVARGQRGEASTEDLRKALVYYRTLFNQLLQVRGRAHGAAPSQDAVVQSS